MKSPRVCPLSIASLGRENINAFHTTLFIGFSLFPEKILVGFFFFSTFFVCV